MALYLKCVMLCLQYNEHYLYFQMSGWEAVRLQWLRVSYLSNPWCLVHIMLSHHAFYHLVSDLEVLLILRQDTYLTATLHIVCLIQQLCPRWHQVIHITTPVPVLVYTDFQQWPRQLRLYISSRPLTKSIESKRLHSLDDLQSKFCSQTSSSACWFVMQTAYWLLENLSTYMFLQSENVFS